MKRVVITGGPCSGKTAVLQALPGFLSARGITALFVAEAATDLIMEGFTPVTSGSAFEFQKRVVAVQLEREDSACKQAQERGIDFVICDRGVCDGAAYLTDDEFVGALAANNLDRKAGLARYDAVVCLESVASANPAAYTCANNEARGETAAEAAALDARMQVGWGDHPHFVLVPYCETFDDKVDAVMAVLVRLAE